MIMALVLTPAIAAALALVLPGGARRVLFPLTAAVHAALTTFACLSTPAAAFGGWLGLDDLGTLFLAVTSGIFLAVSVYAAGYLEREVPGPRSDALGSGVFSNARDAIFVACMLAFLSMMTLVTLSQHFAVLWAAIEGTTLASAPLIYFHRHRRSLEATWKYLLICSFGIAIALLGTFFLAVAGQLGASGEQVMDLTSLLEAAPGLNTPWLKGAFLLMLVGYGTKMGLAPMHTWLPDAHSEAPSAVSAILSGALLNCAFLGILRARQILEAAGEAAFSGHLLVVFGLLSMVLAAFLILGQPDFKRLLAYSSVEHMGILAVGVGLGGAAAAGSMLHLVNHSLVKAMLFLVAGNTLAVYRTRMIREVRGVMVRTPVTGALWIVGLFAVVGSPPFGTFLSELLVLRGALHTGGVLVSVLFLGALAVAFVGLSGAVLRMVQGLPPGGYVGMREPEPWLSTMPPLALAALALLLGLWIPGPLRHIVVQAARAVGGGGF